MNRSLLLAALFFCSKIFSQQTQDAKLNLFFEVNKHNITAKHFLLIDSAITSKQFVVTCIKGFADSTGSLAYNMALSQKRALTVSRLFTDNYYADSIPVEFFGEKNAGSAEMVFDRRVEIWFKKIIPAEVINADEKTKEDTVALIEKYEISNIYFLPDQPIVDPTSFFAVDDAAKYLKRFPGCSFEIVGHVNYVTPPSFLNDPKYLEPLQILSEQRAKTIYELLLERGIPAENMKHKGVGNTQMVFKNPQNDSEKRKNMRVEILISCKK